jgi:hypothetical protein
VAIDEDDSAAHSKRHSEHNFNHRHRHTHRHHNHHHHYHIINNYEPGESTDDPDCLAIPKLLVVADLDLMAKRSSVHEEEENENEKSNLVQKKEQNNHVSTLFYVSRKF